MCLPLHSRSTSTQQSISLETTVGTSSHSHAKDCLAKRNSTTRCTAPHRRDLPHKKPIPKRQRYPPPPPTRKIGIHSHTFLTIPESWSTVCAPELSFTSFSCLTLPVKVFFPYISANTVHRHAHHRFFFFSSGTSPLRPRQCHHTTSQAARSLEKRKRQPNERASLRRVCALFGHSGFFFSGWSLTLTRALFSHRERHSTLAG